jgi:SAM-dependent methyltransferase
MKDFELEHCTAKCPLAGALLQHALRWHDERRLACLLSAYWNQPDEYFVELEREIAAMLAASGQDLVTALAALDSIVAMEPGRQNAALMGGPDYVVGAHLHSLLLGFPRNRVERLCRDLPQLPVDGHAALLAGGANSRLASALLGRHPGWTAMLLDSCAAAVRLRAAHLESRGWSHRAVARQGRLDAVPAPDGTFHAVFALQDEPMAGDLRALREMLRVLKPNGLLSISIMLDPAAQAESAMQALLLRLAEMPVTVSALDIVSPDSGLDALTDHSPDFVGCLSLTLRRANPASRRLQPHPGGITLSARH